MKPIAFEILPQSNGASPRRAVLTAFLLLAAFPWSAAPALANSPSSAVSATGQAEATIVRPLAVTAIDVLDFGMAASSGPGTVTVSAGSSSASYGGSAREACTGAGACPQPHAARFEVTGEMGRDYRIAVPDRLRISAVGPQRGDAELVVTAFSVRSASRPSAGAKGLIAANGRDSFEVGATLMISGALAPGNYSVSVPVTVTYD
jgi:hypothetical protein